MTPSHRLSTALRALHWSQTAFAAEVGVSVRTVQHWLDGRYQAPEGTLAWLERLAALHAAHPAPRQKAQDGA